MASGVSGIGAATRGCGVQVAVHTGRELVREVEVSIAMLV